MGVYSLILTLSPAVRLRTWEVSYRWDHWVVFLLWILLINWAHHQSTRFLPDRDPHILPITALLSGWGLLTIWRLSPAFGTRQVIWWALCLVVFTLGMRLSTNLNFLKRYKYIWLTSGLLLTALTLIFGTNPTGSFLPRLWLGCCGVYLQPSEPLKLLLIIYLAAYLSERTFWIQNHNPHDARLSWGKMIFPYLAPTLFMTGLVMLLLVVQRDLGTAAIFILIYFGIIYSATGFRWVIVAASTVLLGAGLTGVFLFDVVRLRVDAWLNPWLDPSGRSYQIVQSLLAVANGGLFGRGPGIGNPGLVPVPHSDFIFSAIAEETGLLGALAMITLIALLATRCLSAAIRATNGFHRLLAAGIAIYLAGQSILIIGGNLRLLPLTGVTLPLVSYGGSSLLTSFISLLFVLHISTPSDDLPVQIVDHRPLLHMAGLLFSGLLAAAMAVGWWAYTRGPDLLTRTDNARRAIADRSVRRGAIVDRRNQPISLSIKESGEYYRQITYPALSPLVGYTHPVYGQSGLEANLDEYLRGLRGYPGLTIWWNHLQYGQPPPGINLRTTLDLELQRQVDDAFGNHRGAVVILDASSGEILALASHPHYDANQISDQWENLVNDRTSPLLNRATLGYYDFSTIRSELFMHANIESQMVFPAIYGLNSDITINWNDVALQISPLQAAWLATSLSNQGLSPSPVLVNAVDLPDAGWVLLSPQSQPIQVFSENSMMEIVQELALPEQNIWITSSTKTINQTQSFTWVIGGTLPVWSGQSLILSLLLEESNQALAEQIAQKILQIAMGF